MSCAQLQQCRVCVVDRFLHRKNNNNNTTCTVLFYLFSKKKRTAFWRWQHRLYDDAPSTYTKSLASSLSPSVYGLAFLLICLALDFPFFLLGGKVAPGKKREIDNSKQNSLWQKIQRPELDIGKDVTGLYSNDKQLQVFRLPTNELRFSIENIILCVPFGRVINIPSPITSNGVERREQPITTTTSADRSIPEASLYVYRAGWILKFDLGLYPAERREKGIRCYSRLRDQQPYSQAIQVDIQSVQLFWVGSTLNDRPIKNRSKTASLISKRKIKEIDSKQLS